jgi:putative hydrolase of the HAD superfamily
MAEIRNILFDFGNVIIDINIPHSKTLLESLMRPELSEATINRWITDHIHRYETGEIDTQGFLNGMLQQTKPGTSAEDVIHAWNSMLIGIPQYRLTMLEAIKEEHNVFMLSNTNPLHIDWIYDQMSNVIGIGDFEKRFFDGVYYSHLIGARKPDARAFQHVIEDAMITPSKTLFIDDILENIKAAKRLGFRTMHIGEDEEIAAVMKEMQFY